MQVLNFKLQSRETMEIRTNTSGQASRQVSRASRLEIAAKYDTRGLFLDLKIQKKQARKMSLPSSRFQPQLQDPSWRITFNLSGSILTLFSRLNGASLKVRF